MLLMMMMMMVFKNIPPNIIFFYITHLIFVKMNHDLTLVLLSRLWYLAQNCIKEKWPIIYKSIGYCCAKGIRCGRILFIHYDASAIPNSRRASSCILLVSKQSGNVPVRMYNTNNVLGKPMNNTVGAFSAGFSAVQYCQNNPGPASMARRERVLHAIISLCLITEQGPEYLNLSIHIQRNLFLSNTFGSNTCKCTDNWN